MSTRHIALALLVTVIQVALPAASEHDAAALDLPPDAIELISKLVSISLHPIGASLPTWPKEKSDDIVEQLSTLGILNDIEVEIVSYLIEQSEKTPTRHREYAYLAVLMWVKMSPALQDEGALFLRLLSITKFHFEARSTSLSLIADTLLETALSVTDEHGRTALELFLTFSVEKLELDLQTAVAMARSSPISILHRLMLESMDYLPARIWAQIFFDYREAVLACGDDCGAPDVSFDRILGDRPDRTRLQMEMLLTAIRRMDSENLDVKIQNMLDEVDLRDLLSDLRGHFDYPLNQDDLTTIWHLVAVFKKTSDPQEECPEEVPELQEEFLEEVPDLQEEFPEEVPELQEEFLEEVPDLQEECPEKVPDLQEEFLKDAPLLFPNRVAFFQVTVHFVEQVIFNGHRGDEWRAGILDSLMEFFISYDETAAFLLGAKFVGKNRLALIQIVTRLLTMKDDRLPQDVVPSSHEEDILMHALYVCSKFRADLDNQQWTSILLCLTLRSIVESANWRSILSQITHHFSEERLLSALIPFSMWPDFHRAMDGISECNPAFYEAIKHPIEMKTLRYTDHDSSAMLEYPKMQIRAGSDPSKDYELIERLGSGAYASVYRARCLRGSAAHEVAIKIMDAEQDDTKREVDIMSRFCHSGRIPGLVQLLDLVQYGRDIYIVMELVPGGTVFHWTIPDDRTKAAEQLRWMAFQMLTVLHGLHQTGWKHGDLQHLNNFMIDSTDNRLVLLDFGFGTRSNFAVSPVACNDDLDNVYQRLRELLFKVKLKFGIPWYESAPGLLGELEAAFDDWPMMTWNCVKLLEHPIFEPVRHWALRNGTPQAYLDFPDMLRETVKADLIHELKAEVRAVLEQELREEIAKELRPELTVQTQGEPKRSFTNEQVQARKEPNGRQEIGEGLDADIVGHIRSTLQSDPPNTVHHGIEDTRSTLQSDLPNPVNHGVEDIRSTLQSDLPNPVNHGIEDTVALNDSTEQLNDKQMVDSVPQAMGSKSHQTVLLVCLICVCVLLLLSIGVIVYLRFYWKRSSSNTVATAPSPSGSSFLV